MNRRKWRVHIIYLTAMLMVGLWVLRAVAPVSAATPTTVNAVLDAGVEEVTMQTTAGAGHEGPESRSERSRQTIEEFLARELKRAEDRMSESRPTRPRLLP